VALRLLFSAAFDTRQPVGITRYIRRLAPELARLCDMTILTPDPEMFSGLGQVIRIPSVSRRRGARVVWSMARLGRYCGPEHDVLLCSTPVAPLNAHIPKMAVVHDVTPLALPALHDSRDKAAFLLGLHTLTCADGIIAVSNHTKLDLLRRLRRLDPTKVTVVHSGPGLLPTASSEQSFAERLAPFILYVGGHSPHKNLKRLLSAFTRLRCRSDLKLVVVGGGDSRHRERAVAWARQLNVADHVVLLDSLTDTQLSALYLGCRAFIYPSLYEGFGLPVLEAMAHAAAVACSRTSSIPEVGGDAVAYFDPMSVDDIRGKIQLLLDDRELARTLAARALERSRQFSWDRTARAIYALASTLSQGHDRRPPRISGRVPLDSSVGADFHPRRHYEGHDRNPPRISGRVPLESSVGADSHPRRR